jgi:hypothetical protein
MIKACSLPTVLLCSALLVTSSSGCASSHHRRVDGGAAATKDAGPAKLPDHVAGKACKSDAQCAHGRCAKTLSANMDTDAPAAPGGYCTASCATDGECGAGAECAVPAETSMGQCLASCSDQAACRDGYSCVGAGRARGLVVLGSCQPTPKADALGNGVAGATCATDVDCEGGRCASNSPLGTPFPGNYCTGTCTADTDCGTGGACLLLAGTAAGQCFERCSSDAGCTRDGYRCRTLNDGFSACYPALQALPDGVVGKACSSDTDCGGSTDACASMLPFRNFSSYENTPAPDGYCTEPCTLHSDCGANGACISHGRPGGTCLLRCKDMTDCRSGYYCATLTFLRSRDQVCVPVVPSP